MSVAADGKGGDIQMKDYGIIAIIVLIFVEDWLSTEVKP